MADKPTTVSLDELTLEQLASVQTQLEQELQQLTKGFADLRQAQIKFKSCMDAADRLKNMSEDEEVLVPLTSSLYCPGKVKPSKNALVDVGTGYYVEKTFPAAKQMYNAKVLALRSNLDRLQEQIERKQSNLESVVSVKAARQAAQPSAQEQ